MPSGSATTGFCLGWPGRPAPAIPPDQSNWLRKTRSRRALPFSMHQTSTRWSWKTASWRPSCWPPPICGSSSHRPLAMPMPCPGTSSIQPLSAASPLFAVPETTVDDQGLLPTSAISPIRGWLARLAQDQASRAEVIHRTLDGAIGALTARAPRLARAVDEQAEMVAQLRAEVDHSYAEA